MLPESHRQPYQEFLRTLVELQELATASQLDLALLQQNWQLVQVIFQQQIIILTSDGLDAGISSRWQSLQTEIHRSLRLLEMDIIFLRSSRQAVTVRGRLKSAGDRLDQLIGYCQVLLQEE